MGIRKREKYLGSWSKFLFYLKKINYYHKETIIARAYDTPIPGYMTFNTNCLRLWRSLPATEFDFGQFNEGDYFGSLEARQRAETLTSVLYPNDSTPAGKELRLK